MLSASRSDTNFFTSSTVPASSAVPSAVTTRVVTVQRTPKAFTHALKLTARPATPVGPPSSPSDGSSKKRRAAPSDVAPRAVKKRRRSASFSDSDDDEARSSSVSSDRSRAFSSIHSRQSFLTTKPLHATRLSASRSRSTSVLPPTAAETEPIPPRDCWITEDGRPGPGFLSSESVVKELMRSYKAYFHNPERADDWSYQPHPVHYPRVELEYPNTGACERFILLVPKDEDLYNPIMCLRETLYTMIECYLTPTQQALFGTLMDPNFKTIPPLEKCFKRVESPHPFLLSAGLCYQLYDSEASDGTFAFALSSLDIDRPELNVRLSSSNGPKFIQPDYLKLLHRAYLARDGPSFKRTMVAINTLLRLLKYPPLPRDIFDGPPPSTFLSAIMAWPSTALPGSGVELGGIPTRVVDRIMNETYQRAVGPHTSELSRYEAFSSTVYGELLPALVSDIVRATRLCAGKLFVDLGSGVGNVVLQTSLQTGCRSFGVEVMPSPARLARRQLEEFKDRCRMWGVKTGEVELEEGNMLTSKKVDELVKEADVVLVNNKVFEESLNEALRPKFLDLKEGAYVVSLKPFVNSARLTERNLDDISAIFQVSERAYPQGSVSWGSQGGTYYLHRVDREGYADMKRQVLRSSSAARTRGRR